MCFEDIQVAIGTSKLLSEWGAISIFPLSFRSIEAPLSCAAFPGAQGAAMPSNFDCDLGYTIGRDSQPGTFFLLGGQGSNSGATWRNVEECHGRKKGVGHMSMSMVLFSLFKVYFGWSERLRCNRWLELDGTCGTWYQFINYS